MTSPSENDALILDRMMGILHELPRPAREATLAGASFKDAAERMRTAVLHVIHDSPGTPDSVKRYLLRALEGSWGEPYEEKMTRQEYERATLDDALYDAREYLVAGLENQAEWWEHLGDAHRDYAALARLAVAQADELATPDSVKRYLLRALEGSWGEPYEEKMTRQEYERATLDDALYDAREYLVAGLENQAEWWEHLGDAHRDYAALARLAVAQADELAASRA